MRAAILYGSKDLRVEETETPEIGDGDVLVRIVANGLCHTDVTYFEGDVPVNYPLILGHEAAGIITDTGKDVHTGYKGAHVLLPPLYSGCPQDNRCRSCSHDHDNLCDRAKFLGGNRDGAYAEYLAIPADYAFLIDESMDLSRVCITADALSTPFYALSKVRNLSAVEKIAVYGCGGVGLGAVAIARAMNKEVYAVDLKDGSLGIAEELGAIPIKAHENVHKELRKKNIDVALECIGRGKTIEQAYATVRKGGTIIDIGYSKDTVNLPAKFLMANELTLMGSWGCPTNLFSSLIGLVESQKIPLDKIVTKEYQLEEVQTAFEDLDNGKILGRAVIRI